MAITSIKRDWIGQPSIIRIASSDSLSVVGAAGYLAAQLANIEALNAGMFEWSTSDFVLVWSSADANWGFYSVNAAFTSLVGFSFVAGSIPKGTATASGSAVTLNEPAGVITTSSLSTASGSAATVTLTNSFITAASVIQLQIQGGGTNTTPGITTIVTPGAGSATILLENSGVAAAALNGTVKFNYVVT